MTSLSECRAPYEWFIVDAAGDARCCCYSREIIGNVLRTDPDVIWHSDRMQQLRARLANNSFDIYCKGASCQHALDAQSRLQLDGGRLAAGLTIDFRRNGNSLDYTVSGWSNPEEQFTWTTGAEATIKLASCQSVDVPSKIELAAMPFLPNGHQPTLTARVMLANQEIATLKYREAVFRCDGIRITPTAHYLFCDSPTVFSIALDAPVSPSSLGLSDDQRLLGLAIRSIKFI